MNWEKYTAFHGKKRTETFCPAFLNSLTPEGCAPKSVNSNNNFILEENGTAAGLVNFGVPRETDTENRTLGELRVLYVLPEFWDKGLGRKLFGAAEEELRSVGYAGFYLWVLSGNIRARSFYEKMECWTPVQKKASCLQERNWQRSNIL